MLTELRIENFGIMDEMRFHPGDGLSVLTGETGAGKSLLIQSISALLGGRLGAGVVRAGAARALIEGRFREKDEDEIVLRREVSADGRSRVFINGTQTNLAGLKARATSLIEMHGQHDQQRLLEPDHQLESLDAYCESSQLRERVASFYHEWQGLSKKLRNVRMQKEERDYRLEYLHHSVKEIDQLSPEEGELERLTQEKALMQNGGKVAQDLHVASLLLGGEEHAVLTGVTRIQQLLDRHDQIIPEFSGSLSDLNEACILLENFHDAIRQQMDRLQFSPERLEDVEERIQAYKRLIKKHGHSLSRVRDDFLKEIHELANVEENEKKLEQNLADSWARLLEAAELLSRLRRACIPGLEERMARELSALGMPGAEIRISINREMSGEEEGTLVIGEKGLDRVEFYFKPNPGEPAHPLRKIASGGELSRIMLACKSVMMEARPVSLVVFDEVDAGVGGEIAHTLAERLRHIARECQVLVVTHLAQVASRADHHFKVAKKQENGRTVSRIQRLQSEHRVQEVARMMGGARALEFARDCLSMAG